MATICAEEPLTPAKTHIHEVIPSPEPIERKGAAQPAITIPPLPRAEQWQEVEPKRLFGFEDFARNLEPAAYFHLLHLATINDPEEIERRAQPGVTIYQLLKDTERWRGQIVWVQGRLRRLVEFQSVQNEYGIPYTYEGSVILDLPGEAKRVALVVSACPPTEVPLGSDLNIPVRFAGYFLGWWRFDSAGRKGDFAPVFFISRYQVQPSPALAPTPAFNQPLAWLMIGVFVIVFGLGFLRMTLRAQVGGQSLVEMLRAKRQPICEAPTLEEVFADPNYQSAMSDAVPEPVQPPIPAPKPLDPADQAAAHAFLQSVTNETPQPPKMD